jgi:hypothetical protein
MKEPLETEQLHSALQFVGVAFELTQYVQTNDKDF